MRWVLFGVLPALAVMLAFVGIGGPRWLGLALGTALCVPFSLADGFAGWPWQLDPWRGPSRAWLWWSFAVAGVWGTVHDLRALPRPLLLLGELALVGGAPWLVSWPLRQRASFEASLVWLTAAWLATLGVWWLLRRAGRLHPGCLVPFVGALALATDAFVLRATGTGRPWELAGVGAAALLFALATSVWRRPFLCGTGATVCITLAHVGILWSGRTAAELRSWPLLGALLVPVPLWLATTPPWSRRSTAGPLLAGSACVVVAGLAVWSVRW